MSHNEKSKFNTNKRDGERNRVALTWAEPHFERLRSFMAAVHGNAHELPMPSDLDPRAPTPKQLEDLGTLETTGRAAVVIARLYYGACIACELDALTSSRDKNAVYAKWRERLGRGPRSIETYACAARRIMALDSELELDTLVAHALAGWRALSRELAVRREQPKELTPQELRQRERKEAAEDLGRAAWERDTEVVAARLRRFPDLAEEVVAGVGGMLVEVISAIENPADRLRLIEERIRALEALRDGCPSTGLALVNGVAE